MLPLMQQLRAHYRQLIEQFGEQLRSEDDGVDIDQMSYEQLL
jgi:hypothetical protein